MMVLRNLFFVPGAWIKLCRYAANPDRYPEEERYAHLKKIVEHANKGGNIDVVVTGQENFPEKGGFVMYPNHQGMYDVLAIVHACPQPLSVVAKQEVKDVPFLKQVFACMKAFTIDRDDIKQSLQVILNVIKEVNAGRNYIIFPEGTRSRNGNHTLEFKGGSFKASTKSRTPIVPIAMMDTYKAFDTGSIKKLTVQVHVLKPMYYEEYKDMSTVEIAAEVRRRIDETIAANGGW